MDSVLVVDDESGIRTAIQAVLETDELKVVLAEDEASAVQAYLDTSPALVLLDIRLGQDSGIETFRKIRSIDARAIVIFITGHGTTQLAIETMKLGAFDYLVKPLDIAQLKAVVEQGIKISRKMRTPAAVGLPYAAVEESDRIVGNSRAIQAICKNIGRIAPQDVNVLIGGESGTGKELIARAIYSNSRRNQANFLAINCAAIPETLLESELFGHEQGAFTGADRRRVGKFEQCHNGTIFLDEIGDMPLSTQAKMLRLLQDGEFQRVGGNETLRADVRIIAATHQDLDGMIEKGLFRRDLYYRLRGVYVHLPPLRERLEDIAELAHYFMFRFNQQLGTQVETIDENAIAILQKYSWPGNIRQLQSIIREAMIATTGPTLLEEFLPTEMFGKPNLGSMSALAAEHESIGPVGPESWKKLADTFVETFENRKGTAYRDLLFEFDRIVIQHAMHVCDRNQVRAAELLGISRPTLRSKLRSIAAAANLAANEAVIEEV